MLSCILGGMCTHEPVGQSLGIGASFMVEKCIQFMIAHHGNGLPMLLHGPDDRYHCSVLASHVDEVAKKRCDATIRVSPASGRLGISQMRKCLSQTINVCVNSP